jgi:hypothetical protein
VYSVVQLGPNPFCLSQSQQTQVNYTFIALNPGKRIDMMENAYLPNHKQPPRLNSTKNNPVIQIGGLVFLSN